MRKIRQIDEETGEILEGSLVHVRPRAKNGFERWFAMNQDFAELIATSDLRGQDLKVYLLLLSIMGYANALEINQAALARKIGIQPSAFSQSLRRLIEINAIIKTKNAGEKTVFRVSHVAAWRGDGRQHLKAIKNEKH